MPGGAAAASAVGKFYFINAWFSKNLMCLGHHQHLMPGGPAAASAIGK